MKQISTKALVLKRINFGEADRILTLLTSTEGRISLLAKGVRKPKSKLAGGLELFAVNDITFIDGKSELKTVISTRINEHFSNIGLSVERTMAAYDLLKAVDQYTKSGVDPGVYEVLEKALRGLNSLSNEQEIVYVWFSSHLLVLVGSGINIEKPMDAPKFQEDNRYSFSYEDMSFYESKKGAYEANHIKFLRLVIKSGLPEKLKIIENSGLLALDLNSLLQHSITMNKA